MPASFIPSSFFSAGLQTTAHEYPSRCLSPPSGYRLEGLLPIRHGDVYDLVTTDTDNHPLPSEYPLHMQFRMHKILAGIRTPKLVPEDEGPAGYDVQVLEPW